MIDTVLRELTDACAALPEVLALVHGGSRAVGNQDAHSDIDLYVYSREPVPLTARRALIRHRATRMEIGDRFAEESDVWIERGRGVQVDAIYRPAASFEDHVTWLLDRFEARQGNSTAVWHNLLTSRILFDREGWFARLQQRASRPYPEALAQAIIALNVPQLRGAIHSHPHRVALALARGDIVAINEALTCSPATSTFCTP
ncbi:nucleotidyltransferase domain-containing protein [Deinococcus altitudinis]|uniref:nucleotidyltransferase domain-containing protein n=1 Tax=Deinococcus altitudinis TaxID=468914 RepID=UPI003891D25B